MAENKNKNNNKIDDEFSIEKELADMKKSLLEDDKQIISDAINEKIAEQEKEATPLEEAPSEAKEATPSEAEPKEEVKPEKAEAKAAPAKKAPAKKTPAKKAPTKKTPAKKATAKKAPAKKTTTVASEKQAPVSEVKEATPVEAPVEKSEAAKEATPKAAPAKKAPAKKSTTKKKPLTEAQKQAKKEKEKAAKAKEAAKRKEAIKKAKEKEKTKMAVKQAKEKEKARLEALIKREKERSEARAIARKAAEEKLASIESAQKTNDAITSDLDEIKLNKDITSSKSLEKIGPKKTEAKKEEKVEKPENVSESLQRLREQIAAKKDLEQRIMDGKAQKSSKVDPISENLKEIEAKNKDLKEKLAKAQAEVKEPELSEADQQLAKLREEIANLEAKVKELELKEEMMLQENQRLKDEASKIEEDLNNKHSEALKLKDEEYVALQSRMDSEVARLNKEVEDLKGAKNVDTSKLEASLNKEFNAKLKQAAKEATKEINAKQKEVDNVNKELTSTKIQLTKANNALLSKQEELENVKNDFNNKLALANGEIDLLKRDLEEAKVRNVKDADVLSEVEDERNKLVEQNRELEKGKKEVELQESYLNLYKQEIDAKAQAAIKEANDELAKYKANNVVQENLIRAEEQAKYQELSLELNEAKKNLAASIKEVNDLHLKAIEDEAKINESLASVNSLSEQNNSLNEEITRLQEKLRSLTNNESSVSSVEADELRSKLDAKTLEYNNLQAEFERAKASFEEERLAYAKQSEAIDKQLDEMLKGVEENETSIANTALVIENYREALESEKNAHFEAEQQLYDALKAKDQEIKKLEEAIKQNKLDNQIDQIANMVSDLSRRDMFAPRPPYQSQYYGPYDYKDPYDARMREDHNRELAKRDEIIASLQKDKKQEIEALNAKIEALEAQVRDLSEALAKKQEASGVNVNYQELEEYTQKIKGLLVADAFNGFNNLSDLLDAYQNAKKKEELVYSNECDKLNIAFKYASLEEDKNTISAKREILNDTYAKVIKDLDANLDKAVNAIKNGSGSIPQVEVAQVEAAPIVVNIEDAAPASEKKIDVPGEDVVSEPDGDIVSDEAPIYDSYEEKAEAFEKYEALEAKQTPLIEVNEEPQVVITFDSEYLNKLNNIRRTRKSLEERKVVESANHKIELSNNESLQKEYTRKIEELKNRIDELTINYQNGEDHSEDALAKFEVEKEKTFMELTSRQNQLSKLSDDDVRKINLRYHNIIKGIEDQLLRLEEEERELKETYLLKQKKEQAKLNREAELNKKFDEANVNRDEEPRIIESQDEIRERKYRNLIDAQTSRQPKKLLNEDEIADIKVNDKGEVVSGKEEVKPIDQVEVKEALGKPARQASVDLFDMPKEEPRKVEHAEEFEVRESKISAKEVELRKKYESFCQAEKVYSNDIGTVREYKRLKEQYLSYEKAISDNNDKISGLNEVLRASSDSNEIANLKAQISELKAKGESLRDNRDYAKKQVNEASKEKHVKDYIKLVDKIEDAANILKKYQAKRDKKAR